MLCKNIDIRITGSVGSHAGDIAALIQQTLVEQGAHVHMVHDKNALTHETQKTLNYQDITVFLHFKTDSSLEL